MKDSQQGVKRWIYCSKCGKREQVEYGSSTCNDCGVKLFKKIQKFMNTRIVK